jgi:2-methylcitrate dehydratase PrpD
MSDVEEIVSNILETQFNDFDKETVYHARNEIIDVIGCLIAGARAPGCSQLVETVKSWGGREDASILVHGGRVLAQNAALVNSVMARSFDFEVMQPYVDGVNFPAHINATTVPTAIAVAESRGAGCKELITALILGNDLASRLIAAGDYSVISPWDCTGTVTAFGSAAIASRLFGLNKQQARNALGIVFSQLGGTFQNIDDGTHCFKLPQGLASRAGIFSAELAANGFLGVEDPFLSEKGYFPVYSGKCSPGILTKQLGKKFYSEGVFKPYPSCRAVHSSIDCSLELVSKHDIKPGDVQEIILNLPIPVSYSDMAKPFKIRNVPQIDAAFNFSYNIANVFIRKNVKLEHFTESNVRDSRVVALADKVRVIATFAPEKKQGAAVTVKMKDGQEWSASVNVPKGDTTYSPLSEKEIDEKFRSNVAFSKTITVQAAERALTMLKKLDEIDNVSSIIELLVT